MREGVQHYIQLCIRSFMRCFFAIRAFPIETTCDWWLGLDVSVIGDFSNSSSIPCFIRAFLCFRFLSLLHWCSHFFLWVFHQPVHAIIHRFGQSASQSRRHSLASLFVCSLVFRWFVCLWMFAFIHLYPFVLIPFLDWFIHSCTQCFTQLVAQSFIHSLNSFVPSFV